MGSCFSYLLCALVSKLGTHYFCHLKWVFSFNKKKGWSTVVILLSKFRVMKMESYWQDFKSLELKVCDNTDLSEWGLLSSMSMIGTIFAESVDGVNTESVSPAGLDLINKPRLSPRSSSELIVWDLYGKETSQSMEVCGNRSESMFSDLKWCSCWISDTRHPYLRLLEHLLRDFFWQFHTELFIKWGSRTSQALRIIESWDSGKMLLSHM